MGLQTSYVYKTRQNKCLQNKSLQNKTITDKCMYTKQNKIKGLQTRYVYKTKYKTKVYKHVMFTKQNIKQKFTNTLCLQNKTNVYKTKVYKHVMFTKTKYKTESLQNETKVYKHVMFTKQNTKQKFINTLCLQNKTQNKSLQTRYVYKTKQMFTKQKFINKLCLQNKIQNRKFTKQNKCLHTHVYKTKVYKHGMFTKQNTKQKVYKTKLKLTYKLCL